MATRYYIGIDGGGTKTAVCAVSESADDIKKCVSGSSSWREFGFDSVASHIRDALTELFGNGLPAISGVAAGMPCFGEDAVGDGKLHEMFDAIFPGTPHTIFNDAEVGWAGSLALEPGINIVAGTGSIAFGRDQNGKTARSGGWDEFFSDEGSCYWVGRQSMELFSKQADGREAKGALYHIFRREFGLSDDFSFINHMREHYIGRRDAVAGLQLLAERAAREGDETVKTLYLKAADELCKIVSAVWASLSFPASGFNVSYSGGLFKAEELVVPHFTDAIKKFGAVPSAPRCSPVEGAAMLAFDLYNTRSLPALKAALFSTHITKQKGMTKT